MFQVISGRDGTLDYKLHMYTKFYNLVVLIVLYELTMFNKYNCVQRLDYVTLFSGFPTLG